MKSHFRNLVLSYLISDQRISKRYSYKCDGTPPVISVVVPVHNQEKIIARNLESLIRNMSIPFELIVIEDASTDKSRKKLDDFFAQLSLNTLPLVRGIEYYSSKCPIYESRADSFGISKARGEFILEIQADMRVLESGFDRKMIEILKRDGNLFALSARGTHGFKEISIPFILDQCIPRFRFKEQLIKSTRLKWQKLQGAVRRVAETHVEVDVDLSEVFPDREKFQETKSAGWLGKKIDTLQQVPNQKLEIGLKINDGNVWFGETIMRGPLLFRRFDFMKIGGFDVESFFLGNDDHDLFLRSKKSHKYVGFTPILFTSPLIHGSERAYKTLRSLLWRELHRYVRVDRLLKSDLYSYLITNGNLGQPSSAK
jgi:glycosyltransferase involved in cell wall biosynthesis